MAGPYNLLGCPHILSSTFILSLSPLSLLAFDFQSWLTCGMCFLRTPCFAYLATQLFPVELQREGGCCTHTGASLGAFSIGTHHPGDHGDLQKLSTNEIRKEEEHGNKL